ADRAIAHEVHAEHPARLRRRGQALGAPAAPRLPWSAEGESMRNLLACLALLSALTLTACGKKNDNTGGACGSTCNGWCLGTTCVSGTDVTGCGSGSKDCAVCTSGQVCSAGLCQGGGAQAAVGDKCTTNSQCTTGGICAPDVPGGGYCTALCSSTAPCPSGSACVTVSATAALCIKTCTQPSDCRGDHLCLSGGSGPSLRPPCTPDPDCGSVNR